MIKTLKSCFSLILPAATLVILGQGFICSDQDAAVVLKLILNLHFFLSSRNSLVKPPSEKKPSAVAVKSYHCQSCNFESDKLHELRDHHSKEHSSKPTLELCKVCNLKVPKDKLDNHAKMIHLDHRTQKYNCKKCHYQSR